MKYIPVDRAIQVNNRDFVVAKARGHGRAFAFAELFEVPAARGGWRGDQKQSTFDANFILGFSGFEAYPFEIPESA